MDLPRVFDEDEDVFHDFVIWKRTSKTGATVRLPGLFRLWTGIEPYITITITTITITRTTVHNSELGKKTRPDHFFKWRIFTFSITVSVRHMENCPVESLFGELRMRKR